MSQKFNNSYQTRTILFVAMLAIAAIGCSSIPNLAELPGLNPPADESSLVATLLPTEVPTEIPSAVLPPANDENPSIDPEIGWLRFQDQIFGLRFYYPPDWNGPEVHTWNEGILAEVGTDTVYPYGTGLEERVYEVSDSYFVSVQYTLNTQDGNWEEFTANQPWTDTYVALLDLEDGQSITTPRSLTIRERAVEVGKFSGVEYIATLSETAQTSIVYIREAILFDNEFNHIRVQGSPNSVQIPEGEDWRQAYQRIDAENKTTFRQILESVSIEQTN